MANSFFIQQSTVGVDLNNGSSTQLFALGTHVLGSNGTEWVYVQAETSIEGNRCVVFSSAGYTCGMASVGDSILGGQIATAQTSISASAFGWVAIRGVGLSIKVLGTTTAGSTLYLGGAGGGSGTGMLTSNVSASGTVNGISQVGSTVSSSAGTAGLAVWNLTWPRYGAPF